LYRFLDIIAYFPKVKEVTWPWPRPFQGQFLVRRLGLAMINSQDARTNLTYNTSKDAVPHKDMPFWG